MSVTLDCRRHNMNSAWNFIIRQFCSCRRSLRIYCGNKLYLMNTTISLCCFPKLVFPKTQFPTFIFTLEPSQTKDRERFICSDQIKYLKAWPRIAKTNTDKWPTSKANAVVYQVGSKIFLIANWKFLIQTEIK